LIPLSIRAKFVLYQLYKRNLRHLAQKLKPPDGEVSFFKLKFKKLGLAPQTLYFL